MIHLIDAVVGRPQGIHRDLYGTLHGHTNRVDVNPEIATVAVHLQSVEKRFGLFRGNYRHIQVLVIVPQGLAVPMAMRKTPF